MEEIILVTGGCANMISKEGTLFMILPKYGVYGDYVAAFGLKSLAGLKGPPNHDKKLDPKVENFTCLTMNCDKEVFQDLLELYEDTAENIKIRALEKREVIMYYLHKARMNSKLAHF